MSTFVEEVVEEQGFQFRVLSIGSGDIAQEDTLDSFNVSEPGRIYVYEFASLDNATSSPHTGDPSVIQVPTELIRCQ